ncbi:MAG: hypothetical protein KF752_09490 [Pirellulaceae bacterium]|nr:hypothetical protein [Pirellulaceae bacterium]
MIVINSGVLARTVSQLKSILGLRGHTSAAITISSDGKTTEIASRLGDCAVACQLSIPNQPSAVSVPLELIEELKRSSRHDVTFRRDTEQVLVDHWDGNARRSVLWLAAELQALPTRAEYHLANPRSLGLALYRAAQMTDDSSVRYALHCLQLRGRDGQVAATDGRQALVESGFALPLEEVLVPAKRLAKLKLLEKCTGVSVGCTEGWLQLELYCGLAHWRVDLQLTKNVRFPTLDQCFADPAHSRSTLRIDDLDADYLLEQLPRALGSGEIEPLTLELVAEPVGTRASVVLRWACSSPSWMQMQGLADVSQLGSIVQLDLCDSAYQGAAGRVVVSQHNLISALQMGFREFYIWAAPAPVQCQQGGRKYVFGQLDQCHLLLPGREVGYLASSGNLVAA